MHRAIVCAVLISRACVYLIQSSQADPQTTMMMTDPTPDPVTTQPPKPTSESNIAHSETLESSKIAMLVFLFVFPYRYLYTWSSPITLTGHMQLHPLIFWNSFAELKLTMGKIHTHILKLDLLRTYRKVTRYFFSNIFNFVYIWKNKNELLLELTKKGSESPAFGVTKFSSTFFDRIIK